MTNLGILRLYDHSELEVIFIHLVPFFVLFAVLALYEGTATEDVLVFFSGTGFDCDLGLTFLG